MIMRKKEVIRNNKGMSMIIAMIFFMVISLACITLFHVTSGAIMQASNYRNAQIADIMASSLSSVIQEQIEDGVKVIEEKPSTAIVSSDGRELLAPQNSICEYLIKNLYNGWTYYNEEMILQSDKAILTRTLNIEGLEKYNNAEGKISMYWTSDFDSESSRELRNRKLYVTVTISVGGFEASSTSTFEFMEKSYNFTDKGLVDDAYFWWVYNGEMS